MDIIEFEFFLLIFARIISFFVSSPFFSMKGLPTMMKIGFSFFVSLLVFFLVPEGTIEFSSTIAFYLMLIKEVLIGLALGFIANMLFTGLQMAGQMTDMQIGFSMSAMFDPVSQSSVSIFGRLYNWIGLVLFFAVNGHYLLLYGLTESFHLVPLGLANLGGINIVDIMAIFSKSILIAFQISVPLLLITFMTDIIMGFIARTVPQLNVFILGLPLKVLVATLAFVILLPEISNLMISALENIPYYLEKFIRVLY